MFLKANASVACRRFGAKVSRPEIGFCSKKRDDRPVIVRPMICVWHFCVQSVPEVANALSDHALASGYLPLLP